jgi:hypothetical protein
MGAPLFAAFAKSGRYKTNTIDALGFYPSIRASPVLG